mmetsp:Transcript_35941/g.57905  ORF Transcript_35941/g.57905 Transcript_35941/m.57905 type:complete len:240 (-) Transcript_35941:196-915(-)
MPPKGSRTDKNGTPCHPSRIASDKLLLEARLKFQHAGKTFKFVEHSKKNNLWRRCVIQQLRPTDMSQVFESHSDYSKKFTMAREAVVMEFCITYMVKLYVLNYRTLESRLKLVDRMHWSDFLGIPPEIIKKWWTLCRNVEIKCQVEAPTILGFIEMSMVFKKGRVPSDAEMHLRLNCDYMVKLLESREDQDDVHNFKPKCLSDDPETKAQSGLLVKQLDVELFDNTKAAGGLYINITVL